MTRPESKAERAIRHVSELNKLVFALREVGRRGRVERAAAKKVVRESCGRYGGRGRRESTR